MLKLSRELKIGLFALAMIVCLYLGVNYLKGKDIFSSDRSYYALFDRTNGLQTSAPVLLRGVKVGSVTSIALDSDHPDKVMVTLGVKKSIDIPSDSHLVLVSGGLMGDKAIDLVQGASASTFDRGAVIPARIEGGLFESASANMDDLLTEARAVMTSLAATSATLDNVLTRNAETFKGIMDNVEGVTGQLSRAGIDDMIRDMGAFSTMLRDNSARFDNIVGNLDTVTEQLSDADLRGTVDSLGAGIAHLNSVLARLAEGEGTASLLLDDPALYDSLTSATGNLSALLEDLKANPRRYVHFSLFGGGKNRDKDKQ
ncbi:MAG: MlaD family protein [Alistipes sp.]|nr:MlaD family protein [Alistipes sp.]